MDNAINAANEKFYFVTNDNEFLRYYHLRQMALSDQTTQINTAIEEDLEKGLRRGFKKAERKKN